MNPRLLSLSLVGEDRKLSLNCLQEVLKKCDKLKPGVKNKKKQQQQQQKTQNQSSKWVRVCDSIKVS
jgi:hypothetical protein